MGREKSQKENRLTGSESERFDTAIRKLLSVSHEELQRREREWKRKRAKKKRG
jgi:hypothetical protein